jgi:phosphocarrier protein HPr
VKRRRALKTEIIIKLDTIENIKKFASAANKFHSDIDIIRGRYIIDGKSIVGIYAMGAENPVIVRINSDDYAEITRFNEIMEEFK